MTSSDFAGIPTHIRGFRQHHATLARLSDHRKLSYGRLLAGVRAAVSDQLGVFIPAYRPCSFPPLQEDETFITIIGIVTYIQRVAQGQTLK
jgi:hypothetical protein